MTTMIHTYLRWRGAAQSADDERGASLVEYALLVGLIAVVCITAMAFFGEAISSQYSGVGNSLNSAGS